MNDPVLNKVKQNRQEEQLEDNLYYFCSHEMGWSYDVTVNTPIWYIMNLMKTHNRVIEEQKKQSKRGKKI